MISNFCQKHNFACRSLIKNIDIFHKKDHTCLQKSIWNITVRKLAAACRYNRYFYGLGTFEQ